MYTYTIGYGSPEESEYDYLYHKKQFSEKQLRRLVHKAVIAALNKVLLDALDMHSYPDIHREVIARLVKHEGFERMEIEARWTCFAWSSIFVNDGWDFYRDDNNNKLVRAVRGAGFNKTHDTCLRRSAEMEDSPDRDEEPDFELPTCDICHSNKRLKKVRTRIYIMPSGKEVYQNTKLCKACRDIFKERYKL